MNGKFVVEIAGESREIIISLGLRGELFRSLTLKQIEYQNLTTRELMSDADKTRIHVLTERLNVVGEDQEELKSIRQELDDAYVKAFKGLEERQKIFMEELAISSINLNENSITDLLAIVLTERDESGKVIKVVTKEDILWKPEYTDAQEALMDVANGIVEYLAEALKKISKFNQVVHNVSQKQV